MEVLNNRFDLAKKRISEQEAGSKKITQNEVQKYEEELRDTKYIMIMPTINLINFKKKKKIMQRFELLYLKS